MLDQPFINRLRSLMANPPEGSIPMDITPQMAEVMLTYNTANRSVRRRTVESYATQMAEGRWKPTHDPVKFSDDGHLNDGQHRLLAIVKSGVTVRMHVCFGEPRDCFIVTDIGGTRTPGDMFGIHGVPNAALMAAACQHLHQYQAHRAPGNPSSYTAASREELYQLYMQNRRLQESAWVGQLATKSRLMSPSAAVFIHYVAGRRAPTMADEFFRKVLTGVGITSSREPAQKLRNRLIENVADSKKLAPVHVSAYTVLAWNSYHHGRPLVLRWREAGNSDAPFPRIV